MNVIIHVARQDSEKKHKTGLIIQIIIGYLPKDITPVHKEAERFHLLGQQKEAQRFSPSKSS